MSFCHSRIGPEYCGVIWRSISIDLNVTSLVKHFLHRKRGLFRREMVDCELNHFDLIRFPERCQWWIKIRSHYLIPGKTLPTIVLKFVFGETTTDRGRLGTHGIKATTCGWFKAKGSHLSKHGWTPLLLLLQTFVVDQSSHVVSMCFK